MKCKQPQHQWMTLKNGTTYCAACGFAIDGEFLRRSNSTAEFCDQIATAVGRVKVTITPIFDEEISK